MRKISAAEQRKLLDMYTEARHEAADMYYSFCLSGNWARPDREALYRKVQSDIDKFTEDFEEKFKRKGK